jgi:hypothetical protein
MPRKLPTKIKTAARNAGVIAVSLASGFGTHKAIKHGIDRHIYKSIPKSNVEQVSERKQNLIELNRKSKIHEIYFKNTDLKGNDRIHKINFDVARLNEISNILSIESRKNINSIIQNKVKIVNTELLRNSELRKKVISRVGELNYEKYLLSLPMNKIEKVFTKTEIELIRKELKKIPKSDLKELELKLSNSMGWSLLGGLLVSSLMISLGRKKKSTEEFDFH